MTKTHARLIEHYGNVSHSLVEASMKESVRDLVTGLIDRAWDATSDSVRLKLARRALKLDPNELDSYVLIAQSIDTPAEKIALLREAVRKGRQKWAVEMKCPSDYHFWSDIWTRPFMRAAQNLALLLWDSEEHDEAIDIAKLLVRLNSNDNQGIRYLLFAWYPVVSDWASLGRLLKKYKGEVSTEYLYAALLNAVRKGEVTKELVANATKTNAHVSAFLSDTRRPVADVDNIAQFGVRCGSELEAVNYALFNRRAWTMVPGSIEWLVKEVMTYER